jgi:thiol-disulfide isomerase/thioredoxin
MPSSKPKDELLFFYGTECTHCHKMDPLIERLEKEESVKLTKLEVWHNEKNARILEEYDQGNCGGVPFFFNKRNGTWLCGEVSYEELKDWALGKSG